MTVAILLALTPLAVLVFTGGGQSGPSQPATGIVQQAAAPANVLVAPPGAPSWELVPGNHCWDDKAGVIRALWRLGYRDMQACEQNDGGLWIEWWTQPGWPTVKLFQRTHGAPITVSAMYSEPGTADWLDLIPSGMKPGTPVAAIVQAGKDVLAKSNLLRRLPFRVPCGTNDRVVRTDQPVGKWVVVFDYTYSGPPRGLHPAQNCPF